MVWYGIRSLSRETIKDRVATLLQETGLGARANQRIGGILPGGISIKGLSGGEKKRLGLVSEKLPSHRIKSAHGGQLTILGPVLPFLPPCLLACLVLCGIVAICSPPWPDGFVFT